MGMKATVIGKTLNLRAAMDKKSERLAGIPGKTKIHVDRSGDPDWLQVAYQDKLGYVMKEFLDLHPRQKSHGVDGFRRYGEAYLKKGSEGDGVMLLQRELREIHWNDLKVDGIFGPITEAAVKEYQDAKGIERDGIVGVETKSCLFADWLDRQHHGGRPDHPHRV